MCLHIYLDMSPFHLSCFNMKSSCRFLFSCCLFSILVTRQAINQSEKPAYLWAQALDSDTLEVLSHIAQCCCFAHLFDWVITFLISWFSFLWLCGPFLTDPKYHHTILKIFILTFIHKFDFALANKYQFIFDKFCVCVYLKKHTPTTLKLTFHKVISCLSVCLRITEMEHLWSTSMYQ